MEYTHDQEANALYFRLTRKPYAYGRDLDAERRIDYARDGTPIGVEITCVRSGVNLDGMPARDEIAAVLHDLNIPIYTTA